MASIVWMSVFVLLIFELLLTLLLVLPLPRAIRRFLARKIFTYDLARRTRMTANFICFALLLALSDAISTLHHLEHKEEVADPVAMAADGRTSFIGVSIEKQRKFRAERNVRFG